MEDYDYVMMVDENGSPYLAHVDWGKARQTVRNAASSAAGAVKSAGKKSYKYYQKLKEGGKTLYFYSADELKAHYDNLRRQASGAVNSAKNNVRTAAAKASVAANELGNRAAYTAFKARQTANNMRNEFTNRANQASNAIKDKAGVDERERRDAADKAHDDALKAMNEAQARYESAQDRLDEAHELRADAKRNGGAGLSEAEELVRGAAREREAARKAYNKAQQDYNTAYENRDKAQEDYDKTLLGAVDYAKDRVSTAVGANEKRIRDEAKRNYDNSRGDADSYNRAQDLYDKTLLGRVDRAKEAAGRAIDSAQEGARKAVDASKSKFDRMKDDFAKKAGQAKEAVGNTADKVKDAIDTAKQSYNKISKEANDLISEVKNNVYNKIGGDLEKRVIEAQDAAKSLKKEYRQTYDKVNEDESELFKAEQKMNSAYDKYLDALHQNANNRNIFAVSTYKDAYMKAYDEYDAAEDDYRRALEAARDSSNEFRKIEKLYVKQMDKIRDLQNEYDSSLVGRAKKAKGTIDTAVDSAHESISRTASNAKNAFDNARETVSNAANSARETASRAVSSVKDKAGVDERERRDAAKKAADEAQTRYDNAQDRLDEAHELRADAKRNGGAGLSEAEELVRGAAREREAARKDNEAKQKAYRDAQAEYDATVLGKGDKAKEAAGEAVSGIREVWNKLSSGKTLTKKDLEILNEYNRKNR